MNWLAHLVLSEPTAEFRVGNVLADILPITEIRQLPPEFQSGVARHRAIDAFTDKHPSYKQSVARLNPLYRRYGGVIMDIFYDHLLTARWDRYVEIRLDRFVAQFHTDVEASRDRIPAGAYSIFQHMRTGAWLTSYGDVDGVRITLDRISRRLRRPFDLGAAASELDTHYTALTRDFADFFPQIQKRFPNVSCQSP